MKKELLSEIKRMKELAGIINEQHFTQEELMQQGQSDDDFNNLINQDLSLGDDEESTGGMYGTQDQDINAEKADEESDTEGRNLGFASDLSYENSPVAIDTVETTPEEITKNSENLYPGMKYKGMYSGENMMEDEDLISKLSDDAELLIDI